MSVAQQQLLSPAERYSLAVQFAADMRGVSDKVVSDLKASLGCSNCRITTLTKKTSYLIGLPADMVDAYCAASQSVRLLIGVHEAQGIWNEVEVTPDGLIQSCAFA